MQSYPTMNIYAQRMTRIICLMFVLISAGGLVYFWAAEEAELTAGAIFAGGVLVTCLHNILKLYWLKSSVAKAADVDPIYAANYVRGQGMLRMFFTLAVLVGAGFLSQIEALGLPFLLGAIFGLLTMPVAGYSMAFFAKGDYAGDTAPTISNERSDTDV